MVVHNNFFSTTLFFIENLLIWLFCNICKLFIRRNTAFSNLYQNSSSLTVLNSALSEDSKTPLTCRNLVIWVSRQMIPFKKKDSIKVMKLGINLRNSRHFDTLYWKFWEWLLLSFTSNNSGKTWSNIICWYCFGAKVIIVTKFAFCQRFEG